MLAHPYPGEIGMMTLYGLKTCDTCKKACRWLDNASISHTFVDYRSTPPLPQTLGEWAAKRGGFAALINKASTTWRCVPQAHKTPANDEDWLALLHQYPALIRRPVVVMDDGRVHQGFSEANFKTLFGVSA